ncbi:PAS domain S-box protein [Hymenobacter sp. BT770]|uniref:PAS domain-containing sensor histidine kinase n=1 Tax=Hymenobacter sp. BT770 TaxID=2886942 RepID=UPI001D12BF17|nr:PAS domain S-box protein [Hymenobacter sp. BT770]MCC3153176.1 PAS domain S-box protein [Hymenobacter sp. BT770]MDO3415350.1 PAS domain S-box protein [Hymenobacter sp. BT770]
MPKLPDPTLATQAQQRLRNWATQPRVEELSAKLKDAGTSPEVQRLVQELQVHQIELEMQNEELLAAQAAAETARLAAEASRAQYAELYDFAPAALFSLRPDGRIAQLNDRACRLLGTTVSRLTDRRFLLFVSPKSRDDFRAFFDNILKNRQRHTVELHLQTSAGADFVAHLEGTAGTSATGIPIAQLAVVDVTALSQAVERRQRSDEQLQLALAASGTGVWVWTLATNLLEWDARAQRCFGRPHDPAPTSFSVLQSAVHPDDVVAVQRALQATVQHGHPLDMQLRVNWPDATVHYLSAHGKVQYDAQGKPESLVGLVRDETGRRAVEEELDYRNRQVQQLLDNLPMLFARLSPTGEYLEVAGAGLRRIGVESKDLVGQSVFKTSPTLSEPIRRLLAGEPVNFVGNIETKSQHLYFQNYGFFDQQRSQAVLFAIDVTESEQMKKQLLEEQQFTKSLLNHSLDGVAAFDPAGRLTAWNRAMEALTGRAEADAIGQDVFACLPFDRSSAPGRIVDHLLHGAHRPHFHQPFKQTAPDRDFELTAISLNPDGGGLLMLHDVTERNRLHEAAANFRAQQQRETFRMVLLAQEIERKRISEALHNGVGQLLYATKLHLEESADAPAATGAALALLEEAIKATRSVSFELTPSILEDFGLAVALQKLCKNIPPDKLRLHLYLSGLEQPLPLVLTVAIYRMVQELLSNVMKHARAEEATLHVVHENHHVNISMEDNGAGFDVATTVGMVKGIGLTSLYNRAALLGGQFELVSRRGRGTIATITLPVVEEMPEPTVSEAISEDPGAAE